MAEMYRQLRLAFMLLLVANTGCSLATAADNDKESHMSTVPLAADLATISQARVLFLHHSVGGNIIEGIKRLDAGIAGWNHIQWATLEEAATSKGPMLIHFSGGQNGKPKTKIDSFASTIRGDHHLQPALALMKFCYVDFNPNTDVDDLFNYYRNTIEALKREYPGIHFAHSTVPLTPWPTGLKWRIYRLTGKEVWEDMANVKRAEFNRRLKQKFSADPVFDLSRVEATAPDGSLTTFEQGGQNYLSLYPGYTKGDGHLNQLGQQVAGEAAIRFMADALKGRSSAH